MKLYNIAYRESNVEPKTGTVVDGNIGFDSLKQARDNMRSIYANHIIRGWKLIESNPFKDSWSMLLFERNNEVAGHERHEYYITKAVI